MQIKNSRETDYANFIAAQDTNATGQATVRFIETWGGMMECVMEQGVTAVTEAAGLTVQAAADAAGIMRAEDVVAGATRMLGCWVYGDQLREWFVYHPPEILSEAPDTVLNLFTPPGSCAEQFQNWWTHTRASSKPPRFFWKSGR